MNFLFLLCMVVSLSISGQGAVTAFLVRGSSHSASHYYPPRLLGLPRFFSRINGADENQNKKDSQTGWNHNQPSDKSDFWKNRPERYQSSRPPSDKEERERRTGWLHYSSKQPKETTTQKRGISSSSNNKSPINMARRRLERAQLLQQRNHRILSPPTFHSCGEDRVVAVTEHMISIPPHNNTGESLTVEVYFCIVEKANDDRVRAYYESPTTLGLAVSPQQRAQNYVEYASLHDADSMVLYLQGGPGFGAPSPVAALGIAKGSGSWADAALYTHGFQRIVLMDQRGTGKSNPITKQTLEIQFPELFLLDDKNGDIEYNSQKLEKFEATHPEEFEKVKRAVKQATDYLSQFRADNIVKDAEYIREALMKLPPLEYDDDDDDEEQQRQQSLDLAQTIRPWGCSLGQSYGGFCQMTYLSTISHPPRIMLFTGGIAPMLASELTDVYGSLWERVKERNMRYYEMYPGDVTLVHRIVQKLLNEAQKLPSGGRLTARRFLALGIALGGSPNAFASFHEMLATAFVGGPQVATTKSIDTAELAFSRAFLKLVDSQQSYDDHPIYFWLHESIYADGPERSPTNWAAHRAYEAKMSITDQFDYQKTSQLMSNDEPTLFFGEMVFPWFPEDFSELSGIGLRAVAEALATKSDWGPLYNAENMKAALQDIRTKSAAAVYHEDMYVDFDESMKLTTRDGPLGKTKLFVTNEYQHSGLRDNGAALFSKLYGMAKGGTRTPS
jgi:hypothetical protein